MPADAERGQEAPARGGGSGAEAGAATSTRPCGCPRRAGRSGAGAGAATGARRWGGPRRGGGSGAGGYLNLFPAPKVPYFSVRAQSWAKLLAAQAASIEAGYGDASRGKTAHTTGGDEPG